MTPRQRNRRWLGSLIVAASRVLAMPRWPSEGDEVQSVPGVRGSVSYYLPDRELIEGNTAGEITGLARTHFFTEGTMWEPEAIVYPFKQGLAADRHDLGLQLFDYRWHALL